MKKPDIRKELLILLLLLIPMAYLGIIWNGLPAVIPTNFNLHGEPQRMGNKSDFLLLMIFLFLTNLVLYFLFRYMPNTEEEEPPPDAAAHQREYYRIRFMIHVYLAIFTCLVIFMVSRGLPFFMERWTFAGVGLLIALLGAYLRKLQPNYFVGVRTPWTLQSRDIWKKTHRMAGNLWLWTGIVTIVAGFFLPLVTGVFLLIFIGAILAALPYIYSFRLSNDDKG
ncbi:SdpI family protein [Chitinophaga japonensis]|uniref:Putative membrane protein n=1 Tax=Chitinophaga japonensis TaxID=104662 RepID=A0A562TAM7_CHIJA|nr:SdpI family protein [Chitinophaga japonensis]TWI90662.1 putative membrane protein [Chitinophaga japonensis]